MNVIKTKTNCIIINNYDNKINFDKLNNNNNNYNYYTFKYVG